MAYDISFRANQSYDAAALNALASELSAPSATAFDNNQLYGVDDLNSIRQELITKGVAKGQGGECACSIQEERVCMAGGRVFFDSGVRVNIGAEGLSIPMSITDGNIWLEYSEATSDIYLRLTAAAPTGDFVKLATLAGGVVTDARQWAYMKNSSLLPNHVYTATLPAIDIPAGCNRGLVHSIDVGESGYQHLVLYQSDKDDIFGYCAYFDFANHEAYGTFYYQNNREYSSRIEEGEFMICIYCNVNGARCYLEPEYTGQTLNFYGHSGPQNVWKTATTKIILF